SFRPSSDETLRPRNGVMRKLGGMPIPIGSAKLPPGWVRFEFDDLRVPAFEQRPRFEEVGFQERFAGMNARGFCNLGVIRCYDVPTSEAWSGLDEQRL